jgi:hypothetical protein
VKASIKLPQGFCREGIFSGRKNAHVWVNAADSEGELETLCRAAVEGGFKVVDDYDGT